MAIEKFKIIHQHPAPTTMNHRTSVLAKKPTTSASLHIMLFLATLVMPLLLKVAPPLCFYKNSVDIGDGGINGVGFGVHAFKPITPFIKPHSFYLKKKTLPLAFQLTSSIGSILAGASVDGGAIIRSDELLLMRNSCRRHHWTTSNPVLRTLQSSTSGLRRAIQAFDRTQVILAAKKNGSQLGEEGPSPDEPEPPEFQPATVWYQLFIDGETDNESYDAIIPKKKSSRVLSTDILKAVRKAEKDTLKNFGNAQTKVYAYGDDEEAPGAVLRRGDEWLPSLHGGDSPNRPIIIKAMTQPAIPQAQSALGRDDTAVRKAAPRASQSIESQNGQAHVDSIMAEGNIEDVADGEGMRVMKNISILLGGGTFDIVIRADTEPFWQQCIRATELGYRVCAVGTPGIGKTTSIPFLIRLLLHDKKTVVVLLRTEDKTSSYYEFKPSSDRPGFYVCRTYPESEKPQDIPGLQDETSTFIVDPGDTEDSCSPSSTFIARVIIVTSPDQRHWGRSFLKSHIDHRRKKVGLFLFYPQWGLEELLAARSILNRELLPETQLTESDVMERFYEFGGIPRHVFADSTGYKAYTNEKKTALGKLDFDQARKFVTNQVGELVTLDKRQLVSALMGLASVGNGYADCVGVPVSLKVLSDVYEKFLAEIWGQIETGQAVALFERYCMFRLTGVSQESYQARRCVGKLEQDYDNIQTIPLGGCRDWMYAVDIVEAARNKLNVLFVPTSLTNELIDFVYSDLRNGKIHFCAVQVTSSDNHEAKARQIQRFLTKIGDATATIYYMVLPTRFNDFVTIPANPAVNFTRDQQESLEFLHVRVPSPLAYIDQSSEN